VTGFWAGFCREMVGKRCLGTTQLSSKKDMFRWMGDLLWGVRVPDARLAVNGEASQVLGFDELMRGVAPHRSRNKQV